MSHNEALSCHWIIVVVEFLCEDYKRCASYVAFKFS